MLLIHGRVILKHRLFTISCRFDRLRPTSVINLLHPFTAFPSEIIIGILPKFPRTHVTLVLRQAICIYSVMHEAKPSADAI